MKWSLRLVASCAVAMVVAASVLAAPRDASEPTSTVIANQNGDGWIEVLAQGEGPVIVLLPSLGRGASDFDAIAVRLTAAGYRVLRPQPRGIGRSVAPLTGINLHDYAADVARVIEQEKMGPAFVVGHAFGNRVARMLAGDRPELVTAVSMVAADVGTPTNTPKILEAIRNSVDPALPDDERTRALQLAFFAPGNDASVWLHGWYPEALAAERLAGDLTPRQGDFSDSEVPILYVQPSHDPLARVEDTRAYRERFGSRVSVVVIEQASRAVIVEQPDAVSAALVGYARRLWPHAMLQQ
jgi:pimeloyl-ACP methyl ester carboxylesterase